MVIKYCCTPFSMSSIMQNDLIGSSYCKRYEIHSELFLLAPSTGLHQLQMCFVPYKMNSKHSMADHFKKLRKMSTMICNLKATGNTLTKEQLIQTVLHALPKSWDIMKLIVTYKVYHYTL